MGVVVERGLARCPYCVAVTEYFFIELGPIRLPTKSIAESAVSCYREVHGPTAPKIGADPVGDWVPDVPRIPPTASACWLGWPLPNPRKGGRFRPHRFAVGVDPAWPAEVRAGLRSGAIQKSGGTPNRTSPSREGARSTSRS